MAVPCAFFAILEVALALAGVQPALLEDDPFVGFASRVPLFVEVEGEGGQVEMVTARNKRRMFNVQRFPKEKSPAAYRIFCVGGSTTYGRPYRDSTSFCGWLRALLPVADPSRTWQVINAGGISYASYRVAAVMEELAGYAPDLFIIYSAHNEFLERRTYGSILDSPPLLLELRRLLNHTRTYTGMKRLAAAALRRPAAPSPEKQVLPGEVDATLDGAVGLWAYTRDDVQKQRTISHYRFNLRRTIHTAESAGAEVLLVVPASNLRHCTPFKSEHSAGIAPSERHRWRVAFELARQHQAEARPDEALSALEEAAEIDERRADFHYLRAQALYDLGRFAEAREAFERARDEDVCPLRALTEMVGVVEEVAAEEDVPIVDFASFVADRSSHAIAGEELFLDHVHPTIEVHRLLALQMIAALVKMGIVEPQASWNEQAIGAVTRSVKAGIDRRAHGRALTNLARVLGWARKHEEAYRVALRALEFVRNSDTFTQAGMNALMLKKTDEAIAYYSEAVSMNPRNFTALNGLGNALMYQGRVDEAIPHLNRALRINPRYGLAHYNLGFAHAGRGEAEKAIVHYQAALRFDPDLAEAHVGLAEAYADVGRFGKAAKSARSAIALASAVGKEELAEAARARLEGYRARRAGRSAER
ncbi:MAG: tetratricopeptide repeat protein [Myxococcota bacterium]